MVPPVARWEIFYADGSRFTSSDGTWAEAPPFGVFACVFYDIEGVKHVVKEQHDHSQFRWPETLTDPDGAVEISAQCVGGADVKYGLWVSNDEYFALFDAVHGEVTP